MTKIISLVLLLIVCFNNFANATLWPKNQYILFNENISKKNIEIINFCKERYYQTSMGYSNCLKSLNYFETKTASNTTSNFFLY